MRTFGNTIVSMVDHFIVKFNPLNSFIDRIVIWIAPSSIAVACTGTYCETRCEFHSNTACYQVLGCPIYVDYYAAGFHQCESGAYNCTYYENNCCGGSYCGG